MVHTSNPAARRLIQEDAEFKANLELQSETLPHERRKDRKPERDELHLLIS